MSTATSTSPNFFTQATNFISAVSGGVDPRTGLFCPQLNLGKLNAHDGLGPSFPLTLRYHPLNAIQPSSHGWGRGFSLNCSSYDRTAGLLLLANGERYHVHETDDHVHLKQKKLDHLRFVKDNDRDHYRVIYKSGAVEILDGPTTASTLKQLHTQLSPAGHALTFQWQQHRLTQIHDANGTPLLQVRYADADNLDATLTLLPGRQDSYTIQLSFQGDCLYQVVSHALPDTPLCWTLDYEDMGMWGTWLTQLTTPSQLVQTATYHRHGHRFPDSAPRGLNNAYLPYVTTYQQDPGAGQPPLRTTYTYTPTNFLGFGAAIDWQDQQDNLYLCEGDYNYASTETHSDAAATTTTTRTYNHYHLLSCEQVQQGTAQHITRTEYYLQPHTPFAKQPPQFQLPKTRTVTWIDTHRLQTRHEITDTTFDDVGNPLSVRAPNGQLTTYTYYPATGQTDACPPEPNRFIRFPHTVTISPASSDYTDTPVQQTVYTYATATCASTQLNGLVLKADETHLDLHPSGNTLLRRVAFTYATTPDQAGRLLSRTTTHYPDGQDGPAYESTEQWQISVHADTFQQTHTVTTSDTPGAATDAATTLSLTAQSTHTRYTNRLLAQVDPQGQITRYTYDRLGRLTQRTHHADTTYAQTQTYTYTLHQEDDAPAPLSVIVTDPLGNPTRRWLDGLGRPIRSEVQHRDTPSRDSADTPWYRLRQQHYNAHGQLAHTTAYDHLSGSDDPYQLKKTVQYDAWQQPYRADFDDQTQELTQHDPLTLTHTTATLGGTLRTGTTVTYYDVSGHPTCTEQHLDDGTPPSRHTRHYDGRGQLRQETNAVGDTTHYAYDTWGRLILTTLADNTQLQRQYAPFSAHPWLTKISVLGPKQHTATVLGERQLDSLGRLLSSTCGGRRWQYAYDRPVDHRPSRVTGPDGTTRSTTYVPELDRPQTIQAGPIQQSFGYEARSGALNVAQEGAHTLRHRYYPSGRLHTTEADYAGFDTQTLSRSYTVAGQLHTLTDYAGITQTLRRDAYGRVIAMEDQEIAVALDYDAAGRLQGWTLTSHADGNTLTTCLSLDNLGREVQRTITDAQGHCLTLQQTWNAQHQLIARSSSNAQGRLREETYVYNARQQLIDYTCSGTQPPRDHSGHPLQRQQFEYDALGNILTRTTTYADGLHNTTTFHYAHPDDPCQLTGIEHSAPDFGPAATFSRDAAGRITVDELGRHWEYDALGRVQALHLDGQRSDYAYDALNRLVRQQTGQAPAQAHYYRGQRLSYLSDGTHSTRLATRHAWSQQGEHAGVTLAATDAMGSVLGTCQGTATQAFAYTPFGEQAKADPSVLAFQGQWRDPTSHTYPLGNGYRHYHPALMQFMAPDSLSPFGKGGINAYAFASGDPINHADPSGHFSINLGSLHIGWQTLLGAGFAAIGIILFALPSGGASLAGLGAIAGGVFGDISMGAGLAADNTEGHTQQIWSDVAMATGLVAGIADGLAALPALAKLGRLGAEAGSRLFGRAAEAVDNPWETLTADERLSRLQPRSILSRPSAAEESVATRMAAAEQHAPVPLRNAQPSSATTAQKGVKFSLPSEEASSVRSEGLHRIPTPGYDLASETAYSPSSPSSPGGVVEESPPIIKETITHRDWYSVVDTHFGFLEGQ